MKLLIATRNRHKLEEIRAILSLPGLEMADLREVPGAPVVVESGHTFRANAIKKAREVARATGLWTLADDSGIEVAALHGAPGVRSARYAGEPCNDAANNRKLLGRMAGVTDRRARFCCCIALSNPRGRTRVVRGVCEGTLIDAERGAKGFGYDPLFMPCGYDLTFGELDAEVKNTISHRAKALQQARALWEPLLTAAVAAQR